MEAISKTLHMHLVTAMDSRGCTTLDCTLLKLIFCCISSKIREKAVLAVEAGKGAMVMHVNGQHTSPQVVARALHPKGFVSTKVHPFNVIKHAKAVAHA
jgi:hypothetical protein